MLSFSFPEASACSKIVLLHRVLLFIYIGQETGKSFFVSPFMLLF